MFSSIFLRNLFLIQKFKRFWQNLLEVCGFYPMVEPPKKVLSQTSFFSENQITESSGCLLNSFDSHANNILTAYIVLTAKCHGVVINAFKLLLTAQHCNLPVYIDSFDKKRVIFHHFSKFSEDKN